MKKAILVLLGSVFFGFGAFAHVEYDSNYDRGGSHYSEIPYSANITCRAYDSGWEEHWGGHSSCSSCKSKHGSCTEVCQETYYTCTAVAVEGSGENQRRVEFTVSDSSQWTARQKAQDRCWRSTYASCSVDSCTSGTEEVSRDSCH